MIIMDNLPFYQRQYSRLVTAIDRAICELESYQVKEAITLLSDALQKAEDDWVESCGQDPDSLLSEDIP